MAGTAQGGVRQEAQTNAKSAKRAWKQRRPNALRGRILHMFRSALSLGAARHLPGSGPKPGPPTPHPPPLLLPPPPPPRPPYQEDVLAPLVGQPALAGHGHDGAIRGSGPRRGSASCASGEPAERRGAFSAAGGSSLASFRPPPTHPPPRSDFPPLPWGRHAGRPPLPPSLRRAPLSGTGSEPVGCGVERSWAGLGVSALRPEVFTSPPPFVCGACSGAFTRQG